MIAVLFPVGPAIVAKLLAKLGHHSGVLSHRQEHPSARRRGELAPPRILSGPIPIGQQELSRDAQIVWNPGQGADLGSDSRRGVVGCQEMYRGLSVAKTLFEQIEPTLVGIRLVVFGVPGEALSHQIVGMVPGEPCEQPIALWK